MKKVILFLILTVLAANSTAQNNGSSSSKLVKFAQNAALFSQNYTQEKVYLHFDNTGYFLGETIWFKAYVVNVLNNTPSDMSKTLHVEFLNPEGQIIHSKKLRINNGVCSGDFALEDSLPGGFYEIRAYTRSMMNFGPEVVFSRVLPVFDMPKDEGNYSERVMSTRRFTIPNKRDKNPLKDAVNVSFFPEGGDFIQGLTSNVAFKAMDKQGRSIDISGVILDQNNNEVAKFKSKNKGMGVFSLKVDSKDYKARVLYDGKESTFSLPSVQESGYVMTCRTINSDSLIMDIQKSKDIIMIDSLALLVTCRGKLIDFYNFDVPENGKSISFRTTKYPGGVYQFTLYDVKGLARSERLVFKYPKQTKNLEVTSNKSTYDPYERISLKLASLDSTSLRSGSSISLAVRDDASSNFGTSDNSTIATNLLLSSDLKGYIENPSWYFSEKTPEHLEGLDLLMMTQGWRRYVWNYMSGVVPFEAKHPIEEGILIDGEVRSVLFKKPLPDMLIQFWMIRGSSAQQGKVLTDSLGKFSFVVTMYDDWVLNLQTSLENKRKETRILLNRTFSPQPEYLIAAKLDMWTNNKLIAPDPVDSIAMILGQVSYSANPTYLNGLREIKLKEFVTTADKKISFVQLVTRNASVAYEVDKVVDDLRDIGQSEAPSIIQMLEDTNPYFNVSESDSGVRYRYKSKDVRFQIFRNKTESTFGNTETVTVEELTTEDVEKILIVEDYASISNSDAGYDGSYVLIMVFPYGPDQRKNPLGVRTTSFKGYSAPREFYSPTYTPNVSVLDADYRRTLYWNPDVILNAQGKASVEFYNNSTSTKMSISAEGITGNGTLLQN